MVQQDLQVLTRILEADMHLNKMAYNKALLSIWESIGAMNRYIDDAKPWVLAKDEANKGRLGSVLYTVLDGLRAVSHLVYPFMPDTAFEIRRQIGADDNINLSDEKALSSVCILKSGIKLPETKNIFPRIDEKEMLEHIVTQMESERGLDRLAAIADMRFHYIFNVCDNILSIHCLKLFSGTL